MIRFRSISIALVVAALAVSAHAQGTTGGLLYASDFATWTLPQGNTPAQGAIAYPNPDQCRVTSNGYTFLAPKVGRPITIVDGANTETVTPTAVNVGPSGCIISATMAHSHSSYFLKSGTAGAQEAIDYQLSQAQGLNVVLTPEWTRVGGTTGIITGTLKGNTGATILDQRTSQLVAYTWNGSAYVGTTFAAIANGAGVGNCAQIGTGNTITDTGAPCSTGSANIANQATGVIPLATGVAAITAQSHLDDGVTTAATITASEPIAGTSATLSGTVKALSINDRFGAASYTAGTWAGAWSSGTTYPPCAAVSYGGAEYVSTEATTNVTPGTGDSAHTGAHPYDWIYSRSDTTATIPTALDCAAFVTLGNAERTVGAGYWTGGNSGQSVALNLGSNTANYFTCTGVPLSDPAPMINGVSKPNRVGLSIIGNSINETTITQSASCVEPAFVDGTSYPSGTVELPTQVGASTTTYAPKTIHLEHLKINANVLAPYALDLQGFALNNFVSDVQVSNGTTGEARFGRNGNTDSWFLETTFNQVQSYAGGGGSGSVVSCTSVAGANPTCTVSAGGSGYTANATGFLLGNSGGTTAGNLPCAAAGTISVTVAAGAVTAFTPTGFSGCPATLSAWVYDGQQIDYGLDFSNVTDSVLIHPLSIDGRKAAIHLPHGNNKIIGAHPFSGGAFGIDSGSQNTFSGTNCGEQYQGCFNLSSGAGGEITDTQVSSSVAYPYYALFTLSSPSNKLNVKSLICGFQPLTSATEYHTFAWPTGVWDNYGFSAMSDSASITDARWCGPGGAGGTVHNVAGDLVVAGNINMQGGMTGASGSAITLDSFFAKVRMQAIASGTATSGGNFASGSLSSVASVWNGSAAISDLCSWTNNPAATGTNPNVTYNLVCSGSSGTHSVTAPYKWTINGLLSQIDGSAAYLGTGASNNVWNEYNGRAFSGFNATDGTAMLAGGSSKGVEFQVASSAFGSGTKAGFFDASANFGVGTCAGTGATAGLSCPFHVTPTGYQTAAAVKITDQGTCTMTAGTCSAQTLGHTYTAAPQCFANWNGTGTLTGLLKVPSTTTTVTPASSVGTDTAQTNWACFGN